MGALKRGGGEEWNPFMNYEYGTLIFKNFAISEVTTEKYTGLL